MWYLLGGCRNVQYDSCGNLRLLFQIQALDVFAYKVSAVNRDFQGCDPPAPVVALPSLARHQAT